VCIVAHHRLVTHDILQIKESYLRTRLARCRNNWATSELLCQFVGNRRRADRRRAKQMDELVAAADAMDVDA
jgi:hypothetical protein